MYSPGSRGGLGGPLTPARYSVGIADFPLAVWPLPGRSSGTGTEQAHPPGAQKPS